MNGPRTRGAVPEEIQMSRLRIASLISVVALVAAACGGAASATPTPTPTAPSTAAAVATPAPTGSLPTATPARTAVPTGTPEVGLKGPLGDGRQIHSATLLTDGGVLVAVGYASGDGKSVV